MRRQTDLKTFEVMTGAGMKLEDIECGEVRRSLKQHPVSVKSDYWNFGGEREPLMYRIHAYPAKFPAFITQKAVEHARDREVNPKLLMLDKPSLGLSPNVLADVFEKIVEVNRRQNVTILIVEQKVRKVLAIANHAYSLKLGKVAFIGPAADLADDKAKLKELFL